MRYELSKDLSKEPFWVSVIRWFLWVVVAPIFRPLHKLWLLPWRKPDYHANDTKIKIWFEEGFCYYYEKDMIFRCGSDKNGKFIVWFDVDKLSSFDLSGDPYLHILYNKWLQDNIEKELLG